MTDPQRAAPHAAAPPTTSNPTALAALLLGMVALITIGSWVLPRLFPWHPVIFVGLVALLAVVFGHLGLRRAAGVGGTGRGLALAGMWIGYGTAALAVLWLLLVLPAYSTGVGVVSVPIQG